MRLKFLGIKALLSICLVIGGCGYYFPHIYDGPTKVVYLTTWSNRTNVLDLDARIYQSLSGWFQKSQAIVTTKEKAGSDLILAGEIVSIDLPSISWGGDSRATEAKVRLIVRYILKDLTTDTVLMEVPSEEWTEAFSTTGDSSALSDNEKKAVDQIIENLSEKIYLNVLGKLRKMNLKK